MKKKFLEFQVKASDKVKGLIEGWANVSEKNGAPEIDRDGEVIVYNALGLQPGESVTVPFLLQHDWNQPAGKATVTNRSEGGIKGMWLEAQLAVNAESPTLRDRALEAFELIKEGIAPTFSIGFIIKEYGPQSEYNGQSYRLINSIELLEVSVVSVPSNRSSVAVGARSADPAAPTIDEESVLMAAVAELRQAFNEVWSISLERLQTAIEDVLRYPTAQLRYHMLQHFAPGGGPFKLDMEKVCADPVLKKLFRELVDLMPDSKIRYRLCRQYGLFTETEERLLKEYVSKLKPGA